VVGVDPLRPEGELMEVQLAEEDRPGGAQPGHDPRVGRSGGGQEPRAAGRGGSLHGEQVLDGDGDAVEEAERPASHHRGLGPLRLGQSLVGEHGQEGAEPAVEGVDTLQMGRHHLDGRHISSGDGAGQLGRALPVER